METSHLTLLGVKGLKMVKTMDTKAKEWLSYVTNSIDYTVFANTVLDFSWSHTAAAHIIMAVTTLVHRALYILDRLEEGSLREPPLP